MNLRPQLLTLLLLTVLLHSSMPIVLACGPSYIEPVFKFENNPDIPFQDFTSGNIGIVRPAFGRKALFIAYRYVNGGSFSAFEQDGLVEALRGKSPEDSLDVEPVKAWIAARKLVAPPDEKLPDIYTDRNFGGYNFFPNCTRNAFEVAVQILNDRAASHGAEDPNVREWLRGQDQVFEICSSGSTFPREAGPDAPAWLQKDRDYQLAAAHFYALNFDEAIKRFEQIASDNESSWRETADYLVGRTLVRQASLSKNEKTSQEIYGRAELHLESVVRRSGRYGRAANQLIGLIKYRSRPKERLHELANTLLMSGNDNLRQDLIDYTWLLDKFEGEVIDQIQKQKAEEERKRAIASGDGSVVKGSPQPERPSRWEAHQDALQSGEIISVALSYTVPDRTYPAYTSFDFKPDVTDDEIVRKFEELTGRKLTEEEIKNALESKADALKERRRYLGANFQFGKQSDRFGYEGNRYSDEEMPLELIPAFLREDDLSDWIFTFQVGDEQAFQYADRRWRETGSPAWLMAAMTKAKVTSPDFLRLTRDAEKTGRSAPAYATVMYHLARLKVEQNNPIEARKLLDEILASNFSALPVSTQNAFFELRMRVAANIGEFLRFASRKAVAFDNDGTYGHIRQFMENEKSWWNPEYNKETKEEYIRATEDSYRGLLPWDELPMFDAHVADMLNRHFPLDVLAQAATHPELPEHLRETLVLTVWTRAVVLGRRDISMKFAAEGMKQPDMTELLARVLKSKTEAERRNEELWVLIKNPKLTAFVESGIPSRGENEISSWEDQWWTEPVDTMYDANYKEVPKSLPRPSFLTAVQSNLAMKERKAIAALGTGEAYLSQRVFEWAAKSPRDPRIAEALYVVVVVNLPTKYGDGNEEVRDRAMKMLEAKYPDSPWIAKAKEEM